MFYLRVYWLRGKEGVYDSTYSFAFVSDAKNVRSSWPGIILAENVLLTFASLISKKQLPETVHKKLCDQFGHQC